MSEVARGDVGLDLVSRLGAMRHLGTMLGGYNVPLLVDLLSVDQPDLAARVVEALGHTILIYYYFDEVARISASNSNTVAVIESLARVDWFLHREGLPREIKLCVLKIDGGTNTDDLSPASDAFTRNDMPLHAMSMLKNRLSDYEERLGRMKKMSVDIRLRLYYVVFRA